MIKVKAGVRTEAKKEIKKEIKIEVRDLNFYYGEKHVLKHVGMNIGNHQVTALIGPSGCGKSTFLRCINRMNDRLAHVRMEGSLLLDGENIYDRRVDITLLRKKVGMVFQQPTPFPMSVYDNIAYGPRLQGLRDRHILDRKVEEALRGAAVYEELRDSLDRPALGLSGGQQHRLCIARALAVEPEVLLFDEPTSALDPVSTLKIEELMRALKKRCTLVVVTHNMQQALRVSDETAFFLGGELVEAGPTQDIFLRPGNRLTQDYIGGRFG